MMKFAAVSLISLAVSASSALAAGAALPKTGTVKHAAYTVCKSLGGVDLGDVGSSTSADCTGVVKNRDGEKLLDNLAIHCLEESVARKEGYKFIGTCVETDAEGDKLYLDYDGPENGPINLLGGTGKFKGVKGNGKWSVTDAPGNTPSVFVFTLDYQIDWTFD
jgi:hypothetical protein